ncbi:MAG: ribosome recycling factor [Candidatus Omnitrophica bacterium]|nr:ribosome recycling factor [Candidatus Omnitrophota bacterium]
MLKDEFLEEAELEMEEAVEAVRRELAQLRTGRATPALVDGLLVDAYGTKTPLKQLANISIPEARLIVIQPWDKTILPDIEKAIQKSELGISPNSDGKIIRLPIPPLTEDRRRDLVKIAKKIGEEGKVRIRMHRRESIESLKKAEKEGTVPEDVSKHLQDEIQSLTDKYTEKIDEIIKEKDHEIMNF